MDDHFLPDTIIKKTKDTCSNVSAEILSDLLYKLPHDMFSDISTFHEGTYCVNLSEFTEEDWNNLRYLYILGNADHYTTYSLMKNNISPGAYRNKNGNFLLLVHLNESQIQPFLNRYGKKLTNLHICHTKLSALSLHMLSCLETLDLHCNTALSSIHYLGELRQLNSLHISQCDNLRTLPGLEKLVHLAVLRIRDCLSLITLPDVRHLSALKTLDIASCTNLSTLPEMEGLTDLATLNLAWCDNLSVLPELSKISKLTRLQLSSCHSLPGFEVRNSIMSLTYLDIQDCMRLTNMPKWDRFPNLIELNLSRNSQLTTLRLDSLGKVTTVDLFRCVNLERLSGVNSLSNLVRLDLSFCHSLTVLDDMDHLVHLSDINLYGCVKLNAIDLTGCKSLSEVRGIETLYQLTKLNLTNCESLTILDIYMPWSDRFSATGCARKSQLTELTLSGCNKLTKLTCRYSPNLATLLGLDSLPHLTHLMLCGAEKLTTLPGVEKLTQLISLTLDYCSSLIVLPGLGNLTQLHTLVLSGCRSLTALPGLGNLTQLNTLDLSSCSSLTELPGIENLSKLKVLRISDCSSLTELPALEYLTQLPSLCFSNCRNLRKLSGIENLTQLTSLDFSNCSSLAELPALKKLTHLTSLNFSNCISLTELPDLDGLSELRTLDLSGTSITRIPDSIRKMNALEHLDLSDLHLEELPDWLPKIAASFILDKDKGKYCYGYGYEYGNRKVKVYLQNTTVDGVDMSIFLQPRRMIVQWFNERKKGNTVPLNEIKVVFLGDGESGKSHTIARLMNDGGDPVDYTNLSTPGIVIKNKKYDLGGKSIQVHYWDFGGQEILHSMHRIFLTKRTMYVILINTRDDTQGDRARYWLHNVKSFAPDAPVLLVLNKIDQNPKASVDEKDLRSKYDKLTRVVRMSALNDARGCFNREFTEVLLDEIRKTGFLDVSWPISWTKVKEELEEMKGHYIMGDAYQDICRNYAVSTNQKELLHWFNDLGVSFCFCDEDDYALEDYIILRPDWITNALYIILFNECKGAVNGLIPHKSIYHLLTHTGKDPSIRCVLPNAKYKPSDIQYVLGVMRRFHLSFSNGMDHEFIPMLCHQNSIVDIQHLQNDPDILEFNMIFDYLPNNLLHRLMVERKMELDMDKVWRTGARFQQPETGLSSVVTVDDNTLHIFIRHTNNLHRPNTFLAMLKANVDRIWKKMGLQAPQNQIIYKLDGKQDVFDYEELKIMAEEGETTVFSKLRRRRLPIDAIMNQAAPDSLEEENKLLQAVLKACEQIQREPECRGSKEDNRNRRMRDALQNFGYNVHDQPQIGTSESGKDVGEPDLIIYRDDNVSWSVIESLRICDGTKRAWNSHLGKLLVNYNPHGVPFLFLVTYADCEKVRFDKIWKDYQSHIQNHDTGKFSYVNGSFELLTKNQNNHYIQIASSQYRCSEYTPTVYHVFVQIDPVNE